MSSNSGLPWWISPLKCSNWLALRKFTLKKNYSYVQVTLGMTRWTPLTRPIDNDYSDPDHKYEFSSITQSEKKSKGLAKE